MDEFLREAMRARQWTIPQLAEACGVATGLAQKWVSTNPRYVVNPNPASCEKIAAALNLDLDYVLGLAGHRKQPIEPAQHTDIDPDLAIVTAAWPRLDSGLRHAIKVLAASWRAEPGFSDNASHEPDSTEDYSYQDSLERGSYGVVGLPPFSSVAGPTTWDHVRAAVAAARILPVQAVASGA